MPRSTEPGKRVCDVDNITVWGSGSQLPVLEIVSTDYLEEVTAFLKVNSLFLLAPKSTVSRCTSDTKQARDHPTIAIEDTALPLVQSPTMLGVHLDTILASHKHWNYVADRVLKRNNVLKAISGTT